MDDPRFDTLARLWANGVDRRWVLRALTGATAAAMLARTWGGLARAQDDGLPLGGVCASTDQCRRGDMATVICADNGIAADGPLNCCVDRGCCGSDADCCGDLRCAPTPDVCSVCAFPPFPTRFLGETCDSPADCVPSVVYRGVSCVEGRCAAPGVDPPPTANRRHPDPESALAAAVDLARLEAAGAFDALYDRMHPEAQAVVPRAAVVGWYAAEFAPRGAAGAGAVKVRFVDWTWPVTGTTYPGTAEVTYWQRFAGGALVRDAVRLVPGPTGEWGWFFGRDRAFVEEQIAKYAAASES